MADRARAATSACDAASKPKGEPLQLVQLVFGDHPTVTVNDEAVKLIRTQLRDMQVSKIAIISVMGAFRTGKSFLLDIMLRYLRYEASCYAAGKDPEESVVQVRGDGSEYTLPAWMTALGPKMEGVGDNPDGFRFKGGMDVCTEGIWVWSEPFLRKIDGESVGLVLMDTQGAWDSQMTKEQSATIFGLTAVLSSKQVYNISMQIQEDKVENLTYFMRFAQTAIQKASLDIPAGTIGKEDIERPFQALNFLIRDWRHFKKDWTVEQCKDQMKEHLDRHVDPAKVRENSTAEMLNSMFHSIDCFCLPHPGFALEDDEWDGTVTDISPDFIRLVDVYVKDIFQSRLHVKQILGSALTPMTFGIVVNNFVEAFRDCAPAAATFTQAITNSTVLLAKEKSMRSYQSKMDQIFAKNKRGIPTDKFTTINEDVLKEVEAEYARITVFGNDAVRTETWDQINESLKVLMNRYLEDNTRLLEKALASFALISIVGVSMFIADKLSDVACDWWSDTCANMSKLMVVCYIGVFIYVAVHVYLLFTEQGKLATINATAELGKEMARLMSVFGVNVRLFIAEVRAPGVKLSQAPEIFKKVFLPPPITADNAPSLPTGSGSSRAPTNSASSQVPPAPPTNTVTRRTGADSKQSD